MNFWIFIFICSVCIAFCSPSPQVFALQQSLQLPDQASSPFSVALEGTALAHFLKHNGASLEHIFASSDSYTFANIGLLRRAMTHASYSEENNKALSVLGGKLIEASAALQLLNKNVDISSKDLNSRIVEIDNVETSCAVDGSHLGLQKIVRVSLKTSSTSPSVVCGAFRAIFGAIAVDTGSSDMASRVFWKVHQQGVGRAVPM